MAKQDIFKVIFINQNELYEIYANKVYQADLYGFVTVEGIIFGENSSIVLDPSEEKLKTEFERVTKTSIPLHEIIRIDQVTKRGTAKIKGLTSAGTNMESISSFPKPPSK